MPQTTWKFGSFRWILPICLTKAWMDSDTNSRQTLQRKQSIIHCFLVFGYPGETLALVVHILHPN
jgi:hypothetical protein